MQIKRSSSDDIVIALAGNPNTGKSTVFNSLTGLKQHTGNWAGKTVTAAQGSFKYQGKCFIIVDLPGTYSLFANSAEEEAAGNFLCFGKPHATVVVLDATCLERNINLVLQILEITDNVVICVNLLDEAEKKGIKVDLPKLSALLAAPVIGTNARAGIGLPELKDAIYQTATTATLCRPRQLCHSRQFNYSPQQSDAEEADKSFTHPEISGQEKIVEKRIRLAEKISAQVVTLKTPQDNNLDRKIDNILTSKTLGIPIMLALLGLVFWLTITGANIPSKMLAAAFSYLEERLTTLFFAWHSPDWLYGLLVLGVYKTLAWVVSVMLPPMAIFFPLFTLLEDLGYLPRIAFNLDNYFKKACTHGKQVLTMCMGFGCNAAGIIACRIIASPRERLIAAITNNFAPCNGRFPTLIALASIFFVPQTGTHQSIVAALSILAIVVLGVFLTLLVSKLLSKTILNGLPSSFTLELPPYRKPQLGRIIIRSVFDRILFVLARAVWVAAPAGAIIWVLANTSLGGVSPLIHCARFLDPCARLLGLDGFILLAFILGLPANEIVIPLLIMSYTSQGAMLELNSLDAMKQLFVTNGWSSLTAVCTMLFVLNHWPCATTLLTIRKETQSLKWTIVSFLVPTITGVIICFLVAQTARLLGFGG